MKLEVIKLKEDPIDIHASFDTLGVGGGGNGGAGTSTNRLQCLESSFKSTNDDVVPNNRVMCHGTLIGYNTLEAFQTVDKNTLLKDYFCQRFFVDDATTTTTTTTSTTTSTTTVVDSLTSFMLLTFPDLKGHKVLYWFGFPVLLTKTPIVATISTTVDDRSSLLWWQQVAKGIQQYRQQQDQLPPFFIIRKNTTDDNEENYENNIVTTLNPSYTEELNITDSKDVVFAFIDPTTTATTPSSSDDNTNTTVPVMGWTMRNLVAYLVLHLKLGGKTVQILSVRPGPNGGILRGRLENKSASEEQENSSLKKILLFHQLMSNRWQNILF